MEEEGAEFLQLFPRIFPDCLLQENPSVPQCECVPGAQTLPLSVLRGVYRTDFEVQK